MMTAEPPVIVPVKLTLRERIHPKERPYEWVVSLLLALWAIEFLSSDRVNRIPATARLIDLYGGRIAAGLIVAGLCIAVQATIWTPLPRIAYRITVALVGAFFSGAGFAFYQTTTTVFAWSLCAAIALWSMWRSARNGWSALARG